MRKIGFLTKNRLMVEGISVAAERRGKDTMELFGLWDMDQALLDIEILGIEIVIIDTADDKFTNAGALVDFLDELNELFPECKKVILSYYGDICKGVISKGFRDGRVHDFLFQDVSLEYLFAKIEAL